MAPDCDSQAEQLQLRRVQVVRKAAYFVDNLFQLDRKISQARMHHPRVAGDGLACAQHLNLQYRQGLPNIIVKLSRNTGAVRLLCIQHSAAKLIARHFGVAQVLLGPLEKGDIFGDRSQAPRIVCNIVAYQRKDHVHPDWFSSCSNTHLGRIVRYLTSDQPAQAGLALGP